jgi:hypothetical protein
MLNETVLSVNSEFEKVLGISPSTTKREILVSILGIVHVNSKQNACTYALNSIISFIPIMCNQ